MSDGQGELLGDLPADLDLDKVPVDEARERWPRTLVEMHAVIRAVLRAQDDREQLSDAIVRSLSLYFGGRTWYLPSNEKLEIALRDRAIWEEFDGRNVYALAEKYHLTDRMITAILAQQRALHRKKIQPSLF